MLGIDAHGICSIFFWTAYVGHELKITHFMTGLSISSEVGKYYANLIDYLLIRN